MNKLIYILVHEDMNNASYDILYVSESIAKLLYELNGSHFEFGYEPTHILIIPLGEAILNWVGNQEGKVELKEFIFCSWIKEKEGYYVKVRSFEVLKQAVGLSEKELVNARSSG